MLKEIHALFLFKFGRSLFGVRYWLRRTHVSKRANTGERNSSALKEFCGLLPAALDVGMAQGESFIGLALSGIVHI
jgi:hypothetical protein